MGRLKRDFRIRRRPDSPFWQVSFFSEGWHPTPIRVKMKKGEPVNRTEVEQWAAREAALRIVHDRKPVTLNDYAKDFWVPGKCPILKSMQNRSGYKEATRKQRRSILVDRILPKWGKAEVAQIRGRDVDQWLSAIEGSNSLRNQVLITFRQAMRQAVLDDIIPASPIESLKGFSQAPETPQEALTDTLIQKLFPQDSAEFARIWRNRGDTIPQLPGDPLPWHGYLFYTALTTGLRSGEIRALKWKHYRNDIPALVIESQIDSSDRHAPPKRGEYRAVPLTPRCKAMLDGWNAATRHARSEDYIWTNSGAPMQRGRLQQYLNSAMKAAEITGVRITPHTFRHTYTTIMRTLIAKNGSPDEWIQALTGHRSVAMTRRYDHPGIEHLIHRIPGLSQQDLALVDAVSTQPQQTPPA